MARLSALKPRLSASPLRLKATDHTVEAERTVVAPWRAWYKTARWQRLRLEILVRDGYLCQATGVLLIGKAPAPDSPVVDHRRPHRGDPMLFWDPANLWSVSKAWHDREKQREERAGLR